jgi:hypothetical protein
MVFPRLPLGLVPSPLVGSIYGFGSQNPGPPVSEDILTEAGAILLTQLNLPIQIE